MSTLPDSVTSNAFVASNGEFGWRYEDIERAIHAIRDSGYAILGGEAWLVTGPHSWHGIIPQRDGSTPAVYRWETEPRSAGESCQAYCARTARESIDASHALASALAQEIPLELVDRVRFNVTYVASEKPNQLLPSFAASYGAAGKTNSESFRSR